MKWLRQLGNLFLMPAVMAQADQRGQREGKARLRALYSQQPDADQDTVLAEYTRGYLEGYHWVVRAYREAKAEQGLAMGWFKPPSDRKLTENAEQYLRNMRRRSRSDGGAFVSSNGDSDGGAGGGE